MILCNIRPFPGFLNCRYGFIPYSTLFIPLHQWSPTFFASTNQFSVWAGGAGRRSCVWLCVCGRGSCVLVCRGARDLSPQPRPGKARDWPEVGGPLPYTTISSQKSYTFAKEWVQDWIHGIQWKAAVQVTKLHFYGHLLILSQYTIMQSGCYMFRYVEWGKDEKCKRSLCSWSHDTGLIMIIMEQRIPEDNKTHI